MTTKKPAKRGIRAVVARKTATKTPPPPRAKTAPGGKPSKLDRIVAALRTPKGASIPDLMQITGWQAHSVRGVLAGTLKKKRGFSIQSTRTDGERVYRIAGKS